MPTENELMRKVINYCLLIKCTYLSKYLFPHDSQLSFAMIEVDPTEESHTVRSNFVREIVQGSSPSIVPSLQFARSIPNKIVQFWDNLDQLPSDVEECIKTWRKTEEEGFEIFLFDKHQARDFIRQKLGIEYIRAYDKCYHPAMQSDYFRLCYIFVEGGCYVDADDVYKGSQIQHLFSDGRLKIQPLCYDTETNMMVHPSTFVEPGANSVTWIFYFNNNPLIACKGHPIVEHALAEATSSLKKGINKVLPEIQSITGPGLLTESIFEVTKRGSSIEESLVILSDWEDIAESKWELGYRNDTRNWRHVFWK